jgi:myo-inositol 2-dehydrogenase / D-chiro-inositol 1-dehydrogenase
MTTPSNTPTTRREFLKASAVVGGILAAPAIVPGSLFAKENHDQLKVGLVGCGGRGSGAAAQALAADNNAILTAMGDAFEDKLQGSLQSLQKANPERVKVTPDKCFVGLDAYQKVIDSGVDVVLLCSPPGFRPVHFKAAVDAGKHIFCEKPVATDVAGVRSVMESVKVAKQKSLSLVAGFCWRYEDGRREFYKRVHDGFIGDIRAVYATYYTGPVKAMPAASTRPADMGDLAWQISNWYNFVWLSGDGYVEQAVHSVDKVAWAMKDQPPLAAVAVGGRQTPNNEGDIYDHMFVVYDYPGSVKGFVGQRQIAHTFSENADYLIGSAGFGRIPGLSLQGKESWRYSGEKGDMYQNEHNELFASIRSDKPINDGDRMASSTLMAIMGRMAAYTGQRVTWEEILASKETLVPEKLSWDMKLPIAPMAVPGVTPLI